MSGDRLLRIEDAMAKVSMSRRQVYRKIQSGQFPAQKRLSHKVSVWLESDIDAWMLNLGN